MQFSEGFVPEVGQTVGSKVLGPSEVLGIDFDGGVYVVKSLSTGVERVLPLSDIDPEATFGLPGECK